MTEDEPPLGLYVRLRLTSRGLLVSSEVFQAFV
jgi:hypothetical protein